MKRILLLFTLLLSASTYAQPPDSIKIKTDSIQAKIDTLEAKKEAVIKSDTVRHWKKGGKIGADFSQASYTNWAAGGINSISGVALFNVFANYKTEKTSWENSLDLAYGLVKIGTSNLRKSDDKIEFTSKFGQYAVGHWYYSALINFKSQFDVGYNYPDDSTVVSHFLAPGYTLGALGLDYKSEDKTFSFFVSPVTGKVTIVNDQRLADAGAFGVTAAEYDTAGAVTKHGELVRYEFGGYLKMAFKKDIFKNVNFETKLELFTNYLDHPENIDVNWQNNLTMKINKFLSCNVTTELIYDNDIPVPVEREENGVKVPGTGPRLQFKEVLAVGLAYKF
jgi:hypothetical protein